MISKPTFVIVHGAWHPLSCYSTLVNSLQATGYPAMTISYPSLNTGDPFTATCAADSDSIRQQLISVMEKDGGKNIVVIAHSYGGVPGSAGARGLGKSTRMKEGKAGGVIGLICMCAILVPEGTSLKEFLGGNASFQVEDQVSVAFIHVSPPPSTPYAAFHVFSRQTNDRFFNFLLLLALSWLLQRLLRFRGLLPRRRAFHRA